MANPRPSGPRTYLSVHRMLALLVLPAIFFLTRPVMAATTVCDRAGCGTIRQGQTVVCFTPATPAPSSLWSQGQLQPADTGALPRERDTTDFNEVTTNYGARNWFYGVDIQNGYILMGLSHGIGIWDARTDPANPALVAAKRYPSDAGFPYLPSGEQSKIVFGGISAPDDSVAAIVGYSGAGILVFDLSDKTKPRPVYQNIDKTSESVYTAKINGTRYAFMAAPTPGGLYVYNLDKALTFSGCLEDNVTAGNCPGVLVSKVQTTATAASFVHGVGNYVIVSFGGTGGFQIFDMSDPLHPVSKLIGLRSQPVQGVAMWNQGSSYYIGARQGATLTNRQPTTAIYDVSCITGANGCSGLGSPLANVNTDTQSGGEYLTFSRRLHPLPVRGWRRLLHRRRRPAARVAVRRQQSEQSDRRHAGADDAGDRALQRCERHPHGRLLGLLLPAESDGLQPRRAARRQVQRQLFLSSRPLDLRHPQADARRATVGWLHLRAHRGLSRHTGDVHRHLDGLADELAVDVRGRHARQLHPAEPGGGVRHRGLEVGVADGLELPGAEHRRQEHRRAEPRAAYQ